MIVKILFFAISIAGSVVSMQGFDKEVRAHLVAMPMFEKRTAFRPPCRC